MIGVPEEDTERRAPSWAGCLGCVSVAIVVVVIGFLTCAGVMWAIERMGMAG